MIIQVYNLKKMCYKVHKKMLDIIPWLVVNQILNKNFLC